MGLLSEFGDNEKAMRAEIERLKAENAEHERGSRGLYQQVQDLAKHIMETQKKHNVEIRAMHDKAAHALYEVDEKNARLESQLSASRLQVSAARAAFTDILNPSVYEADMQRSLDRKIAQQALKDLADDTLMPDVLVALAFYSDSENYTWSRGAIYKEANVLEEHGDKARQALARLAGQPGDPKADGS